MSEIKDLVHVVNRTALIENILNQVIEAFCEPRQEAFRFFWNVVLDSSVMPMGSKLKVAMAISQELNFNLDQNALHSVLSLRNAFAHHKTESHQVLVVGKTPDEDHVYSQLQILSSSGKLTQRYREDALKDFDAAYEIAYTSLVSLVRIIKIQRSTGSA
jgi:hypothetical protein